MDADILTELRARQQIRDRLEAYFSACDQADTGLIAACFTADATATYHAGTALERTTQGAAKIASELMSVISRTSGGNHAVSNVTIALQGATASSITFAVAHMVRDGRVIVRGLRYDDVLVRQRDSWQISQRRHTPIWQHDAASLPVAATPAR